MKYFVDMYKRYVDFSGRSTRTEFWCAYGIWLAIYVVLYAIAMVAGGVSMTAITAGQAAATSTVGLILMGVLLIFALASFLPLLAIQIRRLRDAGYQWWVFLLCYVGSCICGIGSIVLLVLLCMPTKEPENQY